MELLIASKMSLSIVSSFTEIDKVSIFPTASKYELGVSVLETELAAL